VSSRDSARPWQCTPRAGGAPFASLFWLASLAFALGLHAGDTNLPPQRKGQGISYSHDRAPEIPRSIHVLKIDRSRPDLQFHTTLPKGPAIALGTMTELMKAWPLDQGKPIAAINGDFWKSGRYDGDPEGLQIMRGELISAPAERSCFWIDAHGRPHATNVVGHFKVTWPNNTTTLIGLNEERTNRGAVLYTSALGSSTRTKKGRELILERDGSHDWLPLRPGLTFPARVRQVRDTGNSPLSSDTLVLSLAPQLTVPNVSSGAILQISTGSSPDLRGAKTAIGGGPVLVRNGKVANFTSKPMRHPRTAIGWNDQFYFLVVVDGRQPELSLGMSLPDLAAYMINLGCQHALNLDGGGSTTFWIYGNVMNSPCYGYERPMANALLLVQKTPPQTPQNSRATP
jgi:hypothetical protein